MLDIVVFSGMQIKNAVREYNQKRESILREIQVSLGVYHLQNKKENAWDDAKEKLKKEPKKKKGAEKINVSKEN